MTIERDRRLAAEATPQPWGLATDKPGTQRWVQLYATDEGVDEYEADVLSADGSELLIHPANAAHIVNAVNRLPLYLALAEAVKRIHRIETVGMYEWACFNGDDCGHDDECPLIDVEVCAECWNLWTQDGRDDEAPMDDAIRWPCATAAALQAIEEES